MVPSEGIAHLVGLLLPSGDPTSVIIKVQKSSCLITKTGPNVHIFNNLSSDSVHDGEQTTKALARGFLGASS
jgi:hypothetical protein